ncbi:MAG TPA: glycosyltransferase family 39 protein [Candidatus Paceibacterota bacterium]|nr:glycosyltransferase family 39 protein [Candidatus Paceibacterota bacterium]
MTPQITRLARFFVVGASGVVVNMGVLVLLKEKLGLHYAIASLFAIELSILSNFTLNNAWTWHDRRTGTFGARLLKYHLVAGFTSFCVNWSLLIFLTRFFGIDYRISNLIGIAAATVLNYVLNHKWTFRKYQTGADSIWQMPDWKELKELLTVRGISPRWNVTVIILLALALGLRVAAMAGVPLTPEEAYYWMYSQHPSLSYFDHPPVVAWTIWFGTQLFGNTEFGVRIGVELLMLASSVLMYVFGRMWFGREAALMAALLLQILPVYFGAGLIATMDPALMFFWLVCMVGTGVALQRNCAWGWYLAGFGLGAAMLSKYTGIFLGLGALLAVVGHQPWRRHLRSVHPYLASVMAFVMFAPVLVWNDRHEWASFRFQFVNRFANETISAASVASFVLWQLAIATPFVLAGVVWIYARMLRNRRRLLTARWWLALCFSLPLLLVMSYKSLKYNIHLNWTMPAFLSVFPAVAQAGLNLCRRAGKEFIGRACRRAALGTIAVCLILNLLALAYVLVLQPQTGLLAPVRRWGELAAAVEKVADRLKAETGREPLVIGADKYRLASVLAFYRMPLVSKVRASDFTTSGWILGGEGLGFPYWTKKAQWIGCDCIIVDDSNDLGQFASRFKQFEMAEDVHLNRKTYYIAIGHGLRN